MIKSQDELIDCNEGKRKSDVLLATIDELEKVKKENEELKKELKYMYNRENVYVTKFNIALDCILEYSVRNNWKTTELGDSCYFGSNGYELAEETIDKLKKIKNVDIGKCERLQKQLKIAVEFISMIDRRKIYMCKCLKGCPLKKYYEKNKGCATCVSNACHNALKKIEDLNNDKTD